MSKIKLDDRIENALNAFVATEYRHGSMTMTYSVDNGMAITPAPAFSKKVDKWSCLLRELFLFGPGTFLLYFTTLLVVFFYPIGGVSFAGFFMVAATAFVTYAGVGNLRQIKNLAVPATVIAGAALVSVIRSFFPVPEYLSPFFSWAIYSFPLVLIAAKLVQMWLAEKK